MSCGSRCGGGAVVVMVVVVVVVVVVIAEGYEDAVSDSFETGCQCWVRK